MKHAVRLVWVVCILGALSFAGGHTAAPSIIGPAPLPQNETASGSAAGTIRLLAVDGAGHPVSNLKPEEFRIRVNKEQRRVLSVSSAADAPITVGIFFDVSGSRRSDNLLANELAGIDRFLKSVWREQDAAFVVSFSDRPFTEAGLTNNVSEVISGLHKIPNIADRGSTGLYDALCSVELTEPPSGRGEKLFLVISDFEDNSSHRSEQSMIETMRNEGARIFPIVRDDPRNADYRFRRILKAAKEAAEKTGGMAFHVEREADLNSFFAFLESALKGSYILTYEPLPEGGKVKKLEVESTQPKIKLLYPRD